MAGWTFMTNHGLVLSFLAKHPRITAVEIAKAVGTRERATPKIIADLEVAGYIEKKKEGRRNRYRINPDLPLRHPTQGDTAIGDLLGTLGWRRGAAKTAGRGMARTAPIVGGHHAGRDLYPVNWYHASRRGFML